MSKLTIHLRSPARDEEYELIREKIRLQPGRQGGQTSMHSRLKELYVYPVKGLAGTRIQESYVEPRGLRHDRRWMIVDEAGVFLTQRTFPGLALINTRLHGEMLELSTADYTSISVQAEPDAKPTVDVRVWSDEVRAALVDPEADSFLSAVLKTPVRLVYMPDSVIRPTRNTSWSDNSSHPVSFADGFPILLIGRGSLDDLNARLLSDVSIRRFRPNLVVDGTMAFEEDDWRQISVGELRFSFAKRCSRCSVTTVDPDTGARGKEPLATLSTYRRGADGSVYFGINMMPESSGVVREGDKIELLEIDQAKA